MRYVPIIFAPDSSAPDGPLVEVERSSNTVGGYQSTLPVDDKPVLFDARENAISFGAKKSPGFDVTRVRMKCA